MDWLERGHGGGDGLRPMIKGSSERAADRVSIRSVLRGGDVRSPRKSRRRTKALVGWLLYCCIGVGGTAAAFAVRDTLFPQLGGPTQALWVGPAPEGPLTTEHGASSREGDNTTPITIAPAIVAAAEEAGPGSSIDAQTVPSALSPDAGNAVGIHGPSANAGPATGTSVAQGPGGGHGIIVDEHPTDTSNSGAAPSASPDPTVTTVSTPGAPTPSTSTPVAADSSGKGKGGGGGGGDGGGGGGGGGSDGGHGGDPAPTTTIP